jgi:hypothetical protein
MLYVKEHKPRDAQDFVVQQSQRLLLLLADHVLLKLGGIGQRRDDVALARHRVQRMREVSHRLYLYVVSSSDLPNQSRSKTESVAVNLDHVVFTEVMDAGHG